MSVTLDGNALFDACDVRIEPGSWGRASIERSVCGLDGVLSIDLGQRTRTIQQSGTLRAPSRSALDARIESIGAMMDGAVHTLRGPDGRQYERVRMDSFRQLAERPGGPGLAVEYQITYTQLGA